MGWARRIKEHIEEHAVLGVDSTGGFVPDSRAITAGDGLAGGGDLSADREFDVGAGDGINVLTNSVEVNEAFDFIWTGAHTFDDVMSLKAISTPAPPAAGYLNFFVRIDGAQIQAVLQSVTGAECVFCPLPNFVHTNTLAFNLIE